VPCGGEDEWARGSALRLAEATATRRQRVSTDGVSLIGGRKAAPRRKSVAVCRRPARTAPRTYPGLEEAHTRNSGRAEPPLSEWD
jgi:hypothetical protein